jgi:NAD(P)-dependent dehydrogenase (short-subunit alcohol dehydrogenase family)
MATLSLSVKSDSTSVRPRVVVVGAAGSVGGVTSRSLAEEGYDVVLLDAGPLDQAVAEVEAVEGASAQPIKVDLMDEASVASAAQAVQDSGSSVAAIVVVAAVLQEAAAVTELSADEWDRVMAVNLRGPFLVAKHMAPLLDDDSGSAIVTVGSWWGYEGHALFSAYCASKAGLRVLTQGLAEELAPRGIRVNMVAPGNIDGPMHRRALAAEAALLGVPEDEVRQREWAKIPLGKPARPQDIADAIVFLVGPRSAYMTGSVVDVNGGVVFR